MKSSTFRIVQTKTREAHLADREIFQPTTTMRNPLYTIRTRAVLAAAITALLVAGFAPGRILAADKIWDGGGADNFWQTGENWDANAPPAANDRLIFTGTARLNNTNNFTAGTAFNGVSFNIPAGAFTLRGNQITLGGDITDDQVVTLQTIGLPLALNATRNVNVVTDGFLTLGGAISGPGGITKTGGGLLALTTANTFSGSVTINAGTVSVASDSNLGAVPGSATAGSIVINGGTLQPTAGFALNANRGIALGPPSGGGEGTFDVASGITLTYGGIAANNGAGTGGLTKLRFGELTLSGANTYTGSTTIKNGTVTLDFTQAASPVNNIINFGSALTLGGATAGAGTTNYAALIVNGKAGAASSQTFNGTTIDLGQAQIRANSGAGGSANITLGALARNIGGVVNFIPPGLVGGAGNLTTTATNVNGIIAGWAMVSDGTVSLQGGTTGNPIPPAVATNFASVDASGNIVPYTNYTAYSEAIGNVGNTLFGTNNALIGSDVISDTLRVDDDHEPGQGVTRDVNTITFNRSVNNWSLNIGSNNVLRLGKTGALFSQYRAGSPTWGITAVPGGVNNLGAQGYQDVGTLTAGGPTDNTPGEIIIHLSQAGSGSANNMVIDAKVTDNGTGPVTVVKAGPGFFKLRGHNTYSGGTYVHQGRLQLSGSEVGSSNPDGIGTGPLYIFPGGYLFFAGGGSAITNDMFIAGDAARQEAGIGAIRTSGGWEVRGTVTLIGDATIGGNGNVSGGIAGRITGPYSLTLGSYGTVAGTISISNPSNDWSGTTTLITRLTGGTTPLGNTFISGTNECIPNGFGKGNVVMRDGTDRSITWNLNGYSETINGLSTSGNGPNSIIVNNGITPSTLTVGDNDQSGTFGGVINDGSSSTMALTKIGGGILTLTGANTYTGDTTVNGGTLAVSGSGSIASSANVSVNNGATLDMSGVTGGFSHAGTIGISNGSYIVRTTISPGIGALNLTDARLRLTTLGGTNVETTTLTTGGVTNRIDLVSVGTITSYPTQFTIVKYTGTIGGAGFNFGLGDVPSPSTDGFISNNVANSSVDLVLRDGPKPLTWTGLNGSDWDIATTTNWLAFGLTPLAYLNADSVFFHDTAATNVVNLTTTLLPAALTVSNQVLNYSFTGSGNLSGFVGLLKEGAGTLTVANSGINDFRGGVTVNGGTLVLATDNSISGGVNISGGTVQVGTGGTAGNLPSGNVVNEAALILNRSDEFTAANAIFGSSGSVTKNGSGVLILSGASTYLGPTTVAAGTLKAGSGTALGDAAGGTTVSNGATLDVNGQALGAEIITVSGAGVGGVGAIINTGTGANNALRNVTLAGDATFGGAGRWDIRESAANATDATLSATDLLDHKITKIGANQVSLVGVQVLYLGDVDVQAGMLSVETGTTSLGNPARTLTVAAGATLQLFNTTTPFNKVIVLNGDGLASTVNNGSGENTLIGPITLNGNCVVNAGGTSLTLSGTISGSGSLNKTGGSVLSLTGNATYTGSTVVNGGALFVDGAKTGGSGITVNATGTLGGVGSISEPVTIAANGTLSPGNAATPSAALRVANSLSLGGTVALDVLKSGGAFVNDAVSNVTALTFGGTLQVNVDASSELLATGDVIKLFDAASYTGSFSSLLPATPGAGLTWDTSSLAVNGTLKVTDALPPEPEIEGVVVSGGNIVLSGTGGAPNGTYYVLTSTNVALPLVNWTRVTTNLFDSTGGFSATNVVDPNVPQQFFLLQLP